VERDAYGRVVGGQTSGTFEERANREGGFQPWEAPKHLVHDATSGGTAVLFRNGKHVVGDWADDRDSAAPWVSICSKVALCKRNGCVQLEHDGCIGLRLIGSGTYNVLVTVGHGEMPAGFPETGAVLRLTRPDSGGGFRYRDLREVEVEMENALAAHANGVGVPIYAAACYQGPRVRRTLQYGMVCAMARGVDLNQDLDGACTRTAGAEAAVACADLLYRLSRWGVAFLDVKPGQIIVLRRGATGGKPDYRLTDFDPDFFMRAHADWRALLLLNLALLAAHVRCRRPSAARQGFLDAAGPLLKQLVRTRSSYDSAWLFGVRAACVSIEQPDSEGLMQVEQMLTVVCTSYFYGSSVASDSLARRFKWVKACSAELASFWAVPENRGRWPAWRKHTPPLIEQLVQFACES
jgi:hypothetical protein